MTSWENVVAEKIREMVKRMRFFMLLDTVLNKNRPKNQSPETGSVIFFKTYNYLG